MREWCSCYLGVALGKKTWAIPLLSQRKPIHVHSIVKKQVFFFSFFFMGRIQEGRQGFSLQFSFWSDVENWCSRSNNTAVLLRCLNQKGARWKLDCLSNTSAKLWGKMSLLKWHKTISEYKKVFFYYLLSQSEHCDDLRCFMLYLL